MEKYKIPDYNGTQEFLCELAKRMGKLKKGTAHALRIFCIPHLYDMKSLNINSSLNSNSSKNSPNS
jgi:hypothetical protein